MDLDEFLERTASGDGFGRDSRRGGKSRRQTTACTMLVQDSRYVRNSFHGKEASAPLYMRACTSAYAFLAESVVCISTGVVSTMHQETMLVYICRIRMRLCVIKSLNDMYMSNNS